MPTLLALAALSLFLYKRRGCRLPWRRWTARPPPRPTSITSITAREHTFADSNYKREYAKQGADGGSVRAGQLTEALYCLIKNKARELGVPQV